MQVESRPITNHGVTGVKTAAAAPGRQVLDKTYFLTELRTKRNEIVNVTSKMKEELDALEKKQAQHNAIEKRCNDLSKEVKLLQEVLSDYNTVLDKVGSSAPIPTIQAEHNQLKERNDAQKKRVDEILTQRLTLEQKSKQIESKILDIQRNIDNRINSMPPSQRQQYYELLNEQTALGQEAKRFDDAIDELDKQLNQSEGELTRNPLKQRALQLQEHIRTLTEKKYEIQQEEEKSKMSPEDQREQLMAKVKRDNNEVEAAGQSVRELQEQIKKMEGRIGNMGGANPANLADEASKREKFEELVAKERDLNNFLDSFPSRKASKLGEKQAKEDAIVALLDKITKLETISTSALPSQRRFKEMQDELEYKKMQLENTQSTQERLKEELAMRRTELDKIDTLEDKINAELKQLAEKTVQLNDEMKGFTNVGDIKKKAEDTKARLEFLKVSLVKRKDMLRVVVQEKQLKYQAKKAQLGEHTLQVQLDKQETKLRTLYQNTYQMSEFIKSKESETNYKALANNIAGMVEELNGMVTKQYMH